MRAAVNIPGPERRASTPVAELRDPTDCSCAPQIVTDLDGSEDDEDAPVVVELPEGVQLPD